MASLHYLTIQDILWINLQVTKKVHSFDYARLEEGVFYQYAYGESSSLLPQAARFVSGFLKMRPFEIGNEATALVGCLGFLELNGGEITASADSVEAWFDQVSRTGKAGIETVAKFGGDTHATHAPDVRKAVKELLDRYSGLIVSLASPAVA